MSLLDIVIVNWNAGHQLRDCLSSIQTAMSDEFTLARVVVVDNASTDGSADDLESLPLPITVIRNTENRGFGAACNQGAAGSNADYLLFLNPDTRLNSDSLRRPIVFLDQAAHARVGVCGIRLVDERGETARHCAKQATPAMFWSRLLGLDRIAPGRFPTHMMSDWDHDDSRDVDHVMGAYYLIRQALYQRLSGFDERFFVYLEDLDLSQRVRQADYGIHYLADAQAFHKGGGTSQQVKARRLFYSLNSRLLFAFKHFDPVPAWGVVLGTLFAEPFTRLAWAIAQGAPRQALETLGAYALLWRALPRTLRTARRGVGK